MHWGLWYALGCFYLGGKVVCTGVWGVTVSYWYALQPAGEAGYQSKLMVMNVLSVFWELPGTAYNTCRAFVASYFVTHVCINTIFSGEWLCLLWNSCWDYYSQQDGKYFRIQCLILVLTNSIRIYWSAAPGSLYESAIQSYSKNQSIAHV